MTDIKFLTRIEKMNAGKDFVDLIVTKGKRLKTSELRDGFRDNRNLVVVKFERRNG